MSRTALIYVRISRDKTGAGLGVARQETDCRELADNLGWTVADVLIDNDISAYSGKPRPAYNELLRRLEDGEADAVVAWHTDRLHRSPAQLETFIDVIEKAHAKVSTVKAGPLDLASPSGRMVARMLGAAARYEVEQLSMRQRAKRAEKVRKGEFTGGKRPYGYEPDGVRVRESEAVHLRWAAQQIVSGSSCQSIARVLNERGATTSEGGRWSGVNLRRTLIKPRYAGFTVHHGKVAGEASWPAILDEDTWRAIRAILMDPSRRTSPGPGRRFLGSGLFLCGVCGRGQTMTTASAGGRTSYVCPNSKHVARHAPAVDDVVTEFVLARLSRPDAAGLTAPHTPDVSGVHVQAQGLRERLTELSRLFADGQIDSAQLVDGTARLRSQLEDAERQLSMGASATVLGQFHRRDPAAVWEGLDVEQRRAVVDVLTVVTLFKGRYGRPAGWKPGEPYFDHTTVDVSFRE